jgi:hypothetical protein
MSRLNKLVTIATDPTTPPDIAAMGSARLQLQLEQEALVCSLFVHFAHHLFFS